MTHEAAVAARMVLVDRGVLLRREWEQLQQQCPHVETEDILVWTQANGKEHWRTKCATCGKTLKET